MGLLARNILVLGHFRMRSLRDARGSRGYFSRHLSNASRQMKTRRRGAKATFSILIGSTSCGSLPPNSIFPFRNALPFRDPSSAYQPLQTLSHDINDCLILRKVVALQPFKFNGDIFLPRLITRLSITRELIFLAISGIRSFQ